MKKILIFIFSAVFVASLGFTDVALCGLNANAKIKIKLVRASEITTWTSSTALHDSLMNIDEGESFWIKVYAQNVTAVRGWEVRIKINPTFLSYSSSVASNYNFDLSAAGEKGILLKKDTSGISTSSILTGANTLDSIKADSGQITLSRLFNSASIKTSRPHLNADTAFVAEVKVTAQTAISMGDKELIKVVYAKIIDSSAVSDNISTTGNTDSVTYVPVELASYSAIIIGDNSVKLNWTTATETNNLGFEVQRSIDGIKFEKVKFIDGFGTTSEEHLYTFMDESLPAGTYYYRLAQTDFNGVITYTDAIQVNISTPNEYSLLQNYPNPFNPTTTIKFALKETGLVDLKVYNILGQLVATVINKEMKAGNHTVDFDASRLSSGIYFYSIKTGNFSAVKKMVVMK